MRTMGSTRCMFSRPPYLLDFIWEGLHAPDLDLWYLELWVFAKRFEELFHGTDPPASRRFPAALLFVSVCCLEKEGQHVDVWKP